jgi:hypothetical protein
MEIGFTLDRGEGYFQQHWMAGTPEKGLLGGLKVRGRRRMEVLTYRCLSCGLLESYANVVADT